MAWKRLSKPRLLFVYPLLVVLFVSGGRISETSLRGGMVLLLLGMLLRVWANGYVGHVKVNWTPKAQGDRRQIGRLITAGPYAYVRHPLYLGTLLLGAGFCLIMKSAWVSLIALIGFVLTYRRKMAQEDALLDEEYLEAHRRYRAAVPGLLPRGIRYPVREGRWTWDGIRASKEWKTTLWVVVMMIVVYFWEESVQEHEWLFDERSAYRWCLFGLLVVLAVADGLIELARRAAATTRA